MTDNSRALLCELNGLEILQVGVALVPDYGSQSLALITPWGRSHIATLGENIGHDDVLRRLLVRLSERGLDAIMGMEETENWIRQHWREHD